jgi:hypothetical protein
MTDVAYHLAPPTTRVDARGEEYHHVDRVVRRHGVVIVIAIVVGHGVSMLLYYY